MPTGTDVEVRGRPQIGTLPKVRYSQPLKQREALSAAEPRDRRSRSEVSTEEPGRTTVERISSRRRLANSSGVVEIDAAYDSAARAAKSARSIYGQALSPREAEAPEVSVVTPCLNAMPFVRYAVASVERSAQISGLRVEHVVSDGVSEDGTVAFLAGCHRIRLRSEPDGGVYHALNGAIDRARGRFLIWLNADDWLEPAFLGAAVARLSQNERIDGVIGDTQFVTADGEPAERLNNAGASGSLLQLARGEIFHFNAGVYRTASLRSLGPFATRFPLGGDRDYLYRMALGGLRLEHLPAVAYRFRRHEGSLTEGPDGHWVTARENFLVDSVWARREGLPAVVRSVFLRRTAKQAVQILAHPHPDRSLRSLAIRWLCEHPFAAARQSPRLLRGLGRRALRRLRGTPHSPLAAGAGEAAEPT